MNRTLEGGGDDGGSQNVELPTQYILSFQCNIKISEIARLDRKISFLQEASTSLMVNRLMEL